MTDKKVKPNLATTPSLAKEAVPRNRKPKLIMKTVRLAAEIAEQVATKPKPTRFMRQAITEAVERTTCPKVEVRITVNLSNTRNYSHEFTVETTLTNSFKDAITPFFEAIEQLQREIDQMNGRKKE